MSSPVVEGYFALEGVEEPTEAEERGSALVESAVAVEVVDEVVLSLGVALHVVDMSRVYEDFDDLDVEFVWNYCVGGIVKVILLDVNVPELS